MTGHCFVVPAYGHSPHLRDCLESLRGQLQPSAIVVCSSTPFDGIEQVAAAYGAQLVVHQPNRGIGHDWNVALEAAGSRWVTVAHQDDVYLPSFSTDVMECARCYPDASVIFTDYRELLDDQPQPVGSLLKIKKVLLEIGFLGRRYISRKGPKTRLLRFGCPIPCPAVTFSPRVSGHRFDETLKVNLDWDAWIRLAHYNGGFGYVRKVLMHHRIHPTSETSAGIRDGTRATEDREMFRKLWPAPVADILARAYARSYRYGLPQ